PRRHLPGRHAAHRNATPVTPSPSASPLPAASSPGICGSASGSEANIPDRSFVSIGFTELAATAIRTSPGPGCGSGASPRWRTSGPPYAEYCTARMGPVCLPPRRARTTQPSAEEGALLLLRLLRRGRQQLTVHLYVLDVLGAYGELPGHAARGAQIGKHGPHVRVLAIRQHQLGRGELGALGDLCLG